MLRLGPMELILILLVVILLFGARKLPQLGRAVGETISEFRKSVKTDAGKSEETKSQG